MVSVSILKCGLSKYFSKDLGHFGAPHSPVWSGTTFLGVVKPFGFQMARFQEYIETGEGITLVLCCFCFFWDEKNVWKLHGD